VRALSSSLLVLLALAGCSDLGSVPYDGLSAVTQKSSYAVNETITFIISNDGSQGVFLACCCVDAAFYIDRYENGRWAQTGTNGIPCLRACPSVSIILSPQTRFVGSTNLQEQGMYRFRFPYGFSFAQDMAREVPSNEFSVR